jgi:hypothetical protein
MLLRTAMYQQSLDQQRLVIWGKPRLGCLPTMGCHGESAGGLFYSAHANRKSLHTHTGDGQKIQLQQRSGKLTRRGWYAVRALAQSRTTQIMSKVERARLKREERLQHRASGVASTGTTPAVAAQRSEKRVCSQCG